MTGYTSPDQLPYPNGYPGVPADVPNDLQKLATSTQDALIKRAGILPDAVAAVALSTGWVGESTNVPTVMRYGELVVCRGLANRTTLANIAVNGLVNVGTIPAGYRPKNNGGRWPVAYQQHSTGGAVVWATSALNIDADGSVQLLTYQAGTLAVNDKCWFTGLAWTTR